MQNKANQGRKVVSPVTVLNRVAKWEVFVLNRVGGCWPRRHTSTQTYLECSPTPPPSPPGIFNLARWCSIDQVLVTRSSNESNFTDNKTRNIFKHGKDNCRWGNMDAVICDKHLSSNFSVVWVCKIKVCPLKNSAARVNSVNFED